jgi:hypothetical protein
MRTMTAQTRSRVGATGDDLISDANVTATRAITIRRSPDVVWPWIAQLGQGRGGFPHAPVRLHLGVRAQQPA